MQHDPNIDIVELGAASIETRGVPGQKIEETYGLPAAGLSDE